MSGPSPDKRRLSGHALLNAELQGFRPTSVTARALDAILKAVPDVPALTPYTSVRDAAERSFGGLPDAIVLRAEQLADHAHIDEALFAAKSIDTGDTGLTIITGLRSAVSMFLGTVQSGVDAQQRTDAALKALGIAYFVARLVPGDDERRLRLVLALPAGRELIAYYAAIEVALPLGAAATAAEGTYLQDLVEQQGKSIGSKLLNVIGKQGITDARELLDELTVVMDAQSLDMVPHTAALADTLRSVLPPIIDTGRALQDLVAAGADALPVYRMLCARLAAEACLARAKLELAPEVELGGLPTPADLDAPEPEPVQTPSATPSEPEGVPTPEPQSDTTPIAGTFVHVVDGTELWLVFSETGQFSSHPVATTPPDWSAHAEAHAVGTYRREGDQLHIHWPDGRQTSSTVVETTYTLTIDGEVCRRADYDLTGSTLSGTWLGRGSQARWTFRSDGSVDTPTGSGAYALGAAGISVKTADSLTVHSLFSDLLPDPHRPALMVLGGTLLDRLPDTPELR
jgi:hypothetical protein